MSHEVQLSPATPSSLIATLPSAASSGHVNGPKEVTLRCHAQVSHFLAGLDPVDAGLVQLHRRVLAQRARARHHLTNYTVAIRARDLPLQVGRVSSSGLKSKRARLSASAPECWWLASLPSSLPSVEPMPSGTDRR